MEQKNHILKPSKSTPFPSAFVFLDTETELTSIGHKTKVHRLKIGIAQEYKRIDDFHLELNNEIVIQHKRDFMNWLISRVKQKSHLYIIAHNVVYDATILDLFRVFPKLGYTLQSIYSKGQTSIIRFAKGNSKITLLDNGNIFTGSLERWGVIFNIPKLLIDFDSCSFSELVEYCKRDVEIMVKAWQIWLEFLYQHDCGGFRMTVGSTAFQTWRHKYLKKGIYVHKNNDVLKLERESYHGGRVEVFHQGVQWKDEYYYLDINNMYGYVMQSLKYPSGLQGYSKTLGIKRLISYLSRYAITARVTVNTDEPVYITKVNGHTAYPLGTFDTVLTTHEIEYALMNGHLESVHEFAWYKQENLFHEFVNDFYRLRLMYREEDNPGFEQICKLLINSLYGKFGQTGQSQRIIGKAQPDEVWHMPLVKYQLNETGYLNALGGSVYETWSESESFHAMPTIAAHVTANARLYLWNLMKKAGRENVYYCDTDSLIVNSLGYYNLERLIVHDVLGLLKVEVKSPWLVVNAPKDYEMEGRKKIKGIRLNAVEITPGIFAQEQWIKLAGLIRQGFKSGYTSKEITKEQLRVIYSGVVQVDGRVEPFHL